MYIYIYLLYILKREFEINSIKRKHFYMHL